MSDARAREAERAVEVLGSVEAEARRIVEQLRTAARTWDDVALDAYLGHAPAQLALNERVEPVGWTGEDERSDETTAGRWLRGFATWGSEVQAKALLAWLRVGSGPTETWSASVRSEQARAEAWCTTGRIVPFELPASGNWSIWGKSGFVGSVLDWLSGQDPGDLQRVVGVVDVCTFGVPRPCDLDIATVRSVLRSWPLTPTLVAPLPPGPDLRRRVEALGAQLTGASA